jgi:hypothetical protein
MLSIQMCPTDKTGLGYVPPSTSDIPSTSKTIFVKPIIPESPPSVVDKGKTVMDGEVPVIPQPPAKLPIKRKPLTCHQCGEPGHIRPNCPHRQVQRKKKWQAPKTLMCHHCRVSNHMRPKCPPPKPPRQHRSLPEIMLQGISSCRSLFKQKRLGSPKSYIWKNIRLQKAKFVMKEILFPVLSWKIWSDF